MCKPNFSRNLKLVCTFAASVFIANTAVAQDAGAREEIAGTEASNITTDFTLPLTLDSKNQAIDGKKKTSIFTENVVIRQGSLELLADRVEVDAAAGTGNEVIIASGKPASYKQRKDDGTWVQAQANEIIYKVASRTISLDGDALIMQNEVRVNGDLIVFDMNEERIQASSDDGSSESVRTVLSPGAFSSDDVKNDESKEDQP